jgi:hypothetical protein
MKDTAETAALRTMLKNVNREHSAMLRAVDREGRAAGLESLKGQRLALMSRIAEMRRLQGPETVERYGAAGVWPVSASRSTTSLGAVTVARRLTATIHRLLAVGFGGAQRRESSPLLSR